MEAPLEQSYGHWETMYALFQVTDQCLHLVPSGRAILLWLTNDLVRVFIKQVLWGCIMSELLGEDLDDNYERFLEESLAQGCVWALESDEGWAMCPAHMNDELAVMPMWSQPEYAKIHVAGEWSHYQVVPIAVEELLDDWLPGMHEDVALVGPNWNSNLEGGEMEPLDILEDFDDVASS